MCESCIKFLSPEANAWCDLYCDMPNEDRENQSFDTANKGLFDIFSLNFSMTSIVFIKKSTILSSRLALKGTLFLKFYLTHHE